MQLQILFPEINGISAYQLIIHFPFLQPRIETSCELCDEDNPRIASHFSDGNFTKCSYCNRIEQKHTNFGR